MRNGRFGETNARKEIYKINTELFKNWKNGTTGCANIDCVDLAEVLIAKGYNPAILNLASAKKPGGGYRDGMGAQEKSLCRSSNLSLSLYQYGDPKYINIRESVVPIKEIGYPTPNYTNYSRFTTNLIINTATSL